MGAVLVYCTMHSDRHSIVIMSNGNELYIVGLLIGMIVMRVLFCIDSHALINLLSALADIL